jgi:hypothetical protein
MYDESQRDVAVNSVIYLLVVLFFSSAALSAEYSSDETSARFSEVKDELKDSPFITDYPELKKFLYVPPKAPVYVGLGLAPVGLMGSKLLFSMSLFQVHLITDNWDWEIFSASIGQVKSDKAFANSKHFTAWTSPKYNLLHIFDNGMLSVGPLVGLEYVSFSEIQVRKIRYRGNGQAITTVDTEDMTTGGYIYGISLSETFTLEKDRKFKLSQIFYKQTYSVTEPGRGWTFDYNDPTIINNQDNKDEISPSTVFLLEFAFLF